MAKLKKGIIKFALSFIAGAISGGLLGASVVCTLVSYRMDTLYEKIAVLKNTINDKDAKLRNLEKAINSCNLVLKNIEIILLTDQDAVDEIDKIEIESVIKEKYMSLLGNEVQKLDAEIITIIIDNRILKLNDKEFMLHVEKLVLTEVLKLWVRVKILD
ncbi:MAG: hypothetical protein GX187_08655 [Clostridiaceae bacterium]|nr:hypothetical protein [Clostridiaceae bacterium]